MTSNYTRNLFPQKKRIHSTKKISFLIPLGYPFVLFLVALAIFVTGFSIGMRHSRFEPLPFLPLLRHPVVNSLLLIACVCLTVLAAYYFFHNRRFPVLRMKEQIREIELQRDEIIRKNRDLELARKELAQRTRQIEMTNRFKSEFLANMSHELRTPLNSIIVLSQLLAENRKSNLLDKQVEYARTIFSSGTDLLELINEILDISKIESGKFDIIPESVLLQEITTDLERMFLPVAREKGLDFTVTVASGLPSTLFTDPRRVNQILRNLVSNAIKFTDRGQVTVSITRPEPETDLTGKSIQSRKILFSVSDTGIGIPEDQLHNIFEAYRQADISTSRRYGGTGLGLTISKNLATLLGGEIRVTSRVDQGSVFTLLLPEKYLKENLPRTISRKASSCEACVNFLGSTDPSLDGKRNPVYACVYHDDRDTVTKEDKSVLIIDDDPSFSSILYDLAREHGFKSIVSHNGECGLRCAHQFQPTAILLDVCLPGINGWQVLERLKQHPATRDIPVWFLSGADEPDEVTKLGAAGYLTKPVNVDKIHGALKQLEEILPDPKSKKAPPETTGALVPGKTMIG